MAIFQVAEHFISINGEGRKAGQLAHFIRFAGCNLACGYCDTGWAKEVHDNWEGYSEQELYQLIRKAGIVNVTLTGGEPLLQNGIAGLLLLLGRDPDLQVEIETNGSVEL
ncbi:MAG: radical SAM protein, partial [Lachnospiraceae bacterium]|nr:radical SAM protein [Lachnospiraceae bacterium]